MAKKRLSKEQKIEKAQIAIECHSKSDQAVADMLGVGRSTVKDWRVKNGWVKGRTATIAADAATLKVEANHILNDKTADLTADHRHAVYNQAKYIEEMSATFNNDVKWAQEQAKVLISTKVENENAELMDFKVFADTMAKHKDIALGRNPETAIQINNQSTGDDHGIVVNFRGTD